jgi:type IV pilus assembly protein PilN
MISLNLLPRNLRRRRETGWWRLSAAAVVVVLLAAMGIWQILLVQQVNRLESERANLQNEVNLLQDDIQLDRRLRTQKAELEQALGVEANLRQRFVPWSDLLAQVLYQLPRDNGRLGISLSRLQANQPTDPTPSPAFDEQTVQYEFTLQGSAASQDAMIALVRAYERTNGFAINFQRAERDPQTGLFNFSVVVGLVGKGDKADDAQTP